jgi:MED7 protein
MSKSRVPDHPNIFFRRERMADQESQQQPPPALASTFPNPPPFWRDFRPENITRIEELRSVAVARDGVDPLTLRLHDLPPELINLQPPPEPEDGRWRVFSDQYTVLGGILLYCSIQY